MFKKNLVKKINRMLTILLAVLLVPLFITIFYQRMQLEELLGTINRSQENEEDADRLICIVAKEIGADAPFECIKAQCVIARTNLFSAEETGTVFLEQMTIEELHELWDECFPENYAKFEEAVRSTEGETLQYKNHYIYAAFHAVSAGTTRNMKELYPDSEMPYLVSVPCYEDVGSKDYLSVLYLEKEIKILEKDSAGYVIKAEMDGQSYSGEEIREILSLKSANFTVTPKGKKVRIVTKGHGHGFGLSQHTAFKMAEEGADYKTILSYFFPGAELKAEE